MMQMIADVKNEGYGKRVYTFILLCYHYWRLSATLRPSRRIEYSIYNNQLDVEHTITEM